MKNAVKYTLLILSASLVGGASANECHDKLNKVITTSEDFGRKIVLQKAGKEYMKNVDVAGDAVTTAVLEAKKCVKFADKKYVTVAQLNFLDKCRSSIDDLFGYSSRYGKLAAQDQLSGKTTPNTAEFLSLLQPFADKIYQGCM